jgi:hypothetical protein
MTYETFIVTMIDEEVSRVTAILGADGVPFTQYTSATYHHSSPIPHDDLMEATRDALHGAIERYRALGPSVVQLDNAYLTLWNARMAAVDEPAITIRTATLPASFVELSHA